MEGESIESAIFSIKEYARDNSLTATEVRMYFEIGIGAIAHVKQQGLYAVEGETK